MVALVLVVVLILIAVIASEDADTRDPQDGVATSAICARTYAMLDDAAAQLDDPPTVGSALEAHLPTELGVGYGAPVDRPIRDAEELAAGRSNATAWVENLRSTGFQDGLEREWWSTVGPVASTTVLRFADHDGAIGFQRWIIGASCTSSLDVFAVDGLPGGVGLRIAWSDGDLSEQVSFVRGPYRYLTSVRVGEGIERAWVLDATTRAAAALGIELPDPRTPCSLVHPPFGREPIVGGADARKLPRLLPRVPPGAATPEGWDGKETLEGDPVLTFADPDLRTTWEAMLEEMSFRDRIERDWYTPGGSVDFALERFTTHRRAVAYDRWVNGNVLCWFARSWFPTAVPGGLGLRIVWGDDAVEDTITFVQGRLRVTVAVFGESLPPDHAAVRALARAARRRLAG